MALAIAVVGVVGGSLLWAGLAAPTDGSEPLSVEPQPAEQQVENGKDAGGEAEPQVVWRDDYATALTEAASLDRPVLLRFTADWCPPCRIMDARAWPAEQVQAALARHVVPVVVDVDRPANAEVAMRYGVRGIPTLVLVDSTGEEFARGGFMGAAELARFLQQPPDGR